ncbi:MAG: ABC transporter permease [Syntrophomonadaceae bacterium]|nr:ABC transporter permease [Syntrophomonadaceae bacterium]
MSKRFYPRLAAANLRKNAQVYVPYIITCIITVAMFYIMGSLSRNPALGTDMYAAASLKTILNLGVIVVGLFAAIFLFYTHSFLIKRRKKEFGLFNILGLEKKHLAKVMCWETLYTALISLVSGLLIGMLLSKLMYLILLQLLQFDTKFGFELSAYAAGLTVILFGAIFLLILLNSWRQVHLAQPIELLQGGRTGEREPQARWWLAIAGLLCLGGAYYICVANTNPYDIIPLFFSAVILVVIGTYSVFIAGSIALLKLLRRRKDYYYQTNHFIAVSGMMYRMKQNAAGLASICILSTMVLVMLSSTASLYIGLEDVLRTRYPNEIAIQSDVRPERDEEPVYQAINQVLAQQGLSAQGVQDYRYLNLLVQPVEGEASFTLYQPSDAINYRSVFNLCLLPLEDFKGLTGLEAELNPGQALLYSLRGSYHHPTLSVWGQEWELKPSGDDFAGFNLGTAYNADMIGTHFLIVSDIEVMENLLALLPTANDIPISAIRHYIGFDLDAPEAACQQTYAAIISQLRAHGYDGYSIESRTANRQDFLSLYGGLLFLGLFLGILFIMATVLIIYYKQISEGYDDKERFAIMQKVGLSREEVRRAVSSQILVMFSLPLAAACLHLAFAFPAITTMLRALNLTDTGLFALCTLGSIAIFAVFYTIVYGLTARTYYQIVGEEHSLR